MAVNLTAGRLSGGSISVLDRFAWSIPSPSCFTEGCRERRVGCFQVQCGNHTQPQIMVTITVEGKDSLFFKAKKLGPVGIYLLTFHYSYKMLSAR